MDILQIIIWIIVLYIIVFFASKHASESVLKKYDEHKKLPSVEVRLLELKDLEIISDEEYASASKYYIDLHNSDIQIKKIEKYKSILSDLDSNQILEMDNLNSRIFDLEDIYKVKSKKI